MEISVLSQPRCNNPFLFGKRFCHKRPTSLFSIRHFLALQCVTFVHQKPMWQQSSVLACAFKLGHNLVPFIEATDTIRTRSSHTGSRKGKKKSFHIKRPSHVCEALGEDKNREQGPDENEPDPSEEENSSNSAEDSGASIDKNDVAHVEPVESPMSTDWRTFRARLISMEQQSNCITEAASASQERSKKSLTDGRWAHPILTPEPGCVLIATEKLDGLSIFERTVILLLSDGLNGSSDGPFGLILNRPLPHTVKDMRPNDLALIEAFGNSQVHFGGPLISDLILLHHGSNQAKGYQEVIPGVYFSPAEGLECAAELVRDKKFLPEDIRFFFGYAGWATNQLKDETENGYWYVAACSTDLFMLPSTANLWEEILRIMGGEYAELSKKPKRKLQ
ncbi:hypothetical protein O6H91_08G024800 [Diphasiastrum complanatum]|uniref:Uncharacterized protein n=1 Tax=Diphasiastrum complanatum TaxID=34168 RepID=A0ACC2CVY0_DIPCM|nr:hypothetical protein O6H91_08G024800 [Diphasiastrum complanatum]